MKGYLTRPTSDHMSTDADEKAAAKTLPAAIDIDSGWTFVRGSDDTPARSLGTSVGAFVGALPTSGGRFTKPPMPIAATAPAPPRRRAGAFWRPAATAAPTGLAACIKYAWLPAPAVGHGGGAPLRPPLASSFPQHYGATAAATRSALPASGAAPAGLRDGHSGTPPLSAPATPDRGTPRGWPRVMTPPAGGSCDGDSCDDCAAASTSSGVPATAFVGGTAIPSVQSFGSLLVLGSPRGAAVTAGSSVAASVGDVTSPRHPLRLADFGGGGAWLRLPSSGATTAYGGSSSNVSELGESLGVHHPAARLPPTPPPSPEFSRPGSADRPPPRPAAVPPIHVVHGGAPRSAEVSPTPRGGALFAAVVEESHEFRRDNGAGTPATPPVTAAAFGPPLGPLNAAQAHDVESALRSCSSVAARRTAPACLTQPPPPVAAVAPPPASARRAARRCPRAAAAVRSRRWILLCTLRRSRRGRLLPTSATTRRRRPQVHRGHRRHRWSPRCRRRR